MQRLTPRTLVPTLLLLAKDPWGNRDALLDLMRREPLDGAHRWGAAFVLAIQRPRGLAARMLEDVRFRLDVTVHDPGAKAPGIGIGGGGGATTRGGRDLPPYAHYVLFDTPLRGSLSVKWAKPHLFALRKEYAGPSLTTMQKTLPDARTRHALRVLAVMLSEEPKAYAAIGRSSIGVAWVSPEQLQAHVAREKERLRLIWQSLVDDLRNAELLEEDGAPAQPSIDVLVRDDRKVKEPPLPEIE